MLLASLREYESSGGRLIIAAQKNGVEAICYGSFVRGSVRPGLSDIDFLVYSPEKSYFISPQIQGIIARVIDDIQYNLGIPIQVTWTTQNTLGNASFFSEDEFYLQEVRRGYTSQYKTRNIEKILEQRGLEGDEADKAMIRFFQRKIARLGAKLPLLKIISQKNIFTLTDADIGNLQSTWNIIKKGIHLCSLKKRLKGEIFSFDVSDLDDIPSYTPARYKSILSRITDLKNWFEYLQSPGAFDELEKLIREDFEIICQYIDTDLGPTSLSSAVLGAEPPTSSI